MLMLAICRLTELHSATQGSFDDPCVYLDKKHEKGFDSGAQSGTQFTIKITDDKKRKQTSCHIFSLGYNYFHATAIWFFCKVPGHCGIAGMVGLVHFRILISHFLDVAY